jgi:hypothetical protein
MVRRQIQNPSILESLGFCVAEANDYTVFAEANGYTVFASISVGDCEGQQRLS